MMALTQPFKNKLNFFCRIDGKRLAYGLYPGLAHAECSETKGFDELAQICHVLMNSFGAQKTLWAAFVS